MKYLLNNYFLRRAKANGITDDEIRLIFDDIHKERAVSLGRK